MSNVLCDLYGFPLTHSEKHIDEIEWINAQRWMDGWMVGWNKEFLRGRMPICLLRNERQKERKQKFGIQQCLHGTAMNQDKLPRLMVYLK